MLTTTNRSAELEHDYADYDPKDRLDSIARHRDMDTRRYNKLFGRALVGVLAVVAAFELNGLANSSPTRTVRETVQPGDHPGLIATRAESQFGNEQMGAGAGEFNVHVEAVRLANKYGALTPGETIEVHVK